jgi:hypothetical protein
MKHIMMATVAFFALAAPALAQNATSAEISAAISGNTVQGSMDASGVYTEFYAEGGTVFGPDYKAAWTVEGDQMCWVYDGSPKDCWDAKIDGDQIQWIKDGTSQGTGTILPGNPNAFN